MSLNGIRENFVIREKPAIGDIVGDASGNQYEVITAGTKYLVVRNTATLKSYTMRAGDAYIINKKGSNA